MRRREFITLLGGATVWPLAARAQEAGRTYRIAALSPSPRGAPTSMALFDGLQRFGFIEGQNLTINWRAYGQHIELISRYSEELFGTSADVFLALGASAAAAPGPAEPAVRELARI
jgi:putative ABC transport system substrate-binding protein